MLKRRFICTDTTIGILSAIYDAWKMDRTDTEAGIPLWGTVQHEMFCEYYEVEENERKAGAVRKLIRERLGKQAYSDISYAILSKDEDKGTAILQTMVAARELADSHRIMEHLSHPAVRRVFEMSRNVGREAHYWEEFLRFREMKPKILYAEITPQNQVLPAIADHFADRFPLEDFVIYDKNHASYMIHPRQKKWMFMTDHEQKWEAAKELSEEEEAWCTLWKGFRKSISIKDRENKKLQTQNMPLRYRGDMPEYGKS
ncbi:MULTISPECIES: TIGR03915 family putative DNA repair protein [Sellimonas]|uniref:DNA metabolism protein n=1 Tax=Sellimonas caecigallum TaxID=2592333 RepID=A0ABS7L7A3_9FIRM|nr:MULTISPECIES: TIGR03915 family putative DNA repair protein [Sellimonas]MBY0758660.1 DNA metabolism protein [Sellimonas caecigallum]OUP03197.1 hypothetical protein B5F37_00715 [Drancourtella sp. An210]OUP66389.1 hypothetical protein B5F13_04180 [Drancourtella sp. An177]